jgi:hypothetical protein
MISGADQLSHVSDTNTMPASTIAAAAISTIVSPNCASGYYKILDRLQPL